MKLYQLGSSIFLLLFGIFTCFEAQKLEIGRITRPGPGFFPFWSGLVLVISSLVLAIKSSREKLESSPSFGEMWKGLHWGKVLFCLAVVVLYAIFLECVGYIISTFLLMLLLFRAVEMGYLLAIPGSIITSFITYALFRLWLQVQLPVGLWGM